MNFLKEIYSHFMKSSTFEKGAALSYYTVFSFLPITMIITSVLGLIFKGDTINAEWNEMLKGIIGDQGVYQIEEILINRHLKENSALVTAIGIGTMLFAATGMFNQIQKSLNAIWGLKAKPEKSIINYFTRRITSFSILGLIGLILLISTIINSIFYRFASKLPENLFYAFIYEHLISFFLITMLFTILFRFIRNAVVPWKNALVSAVFTSVLFFIGKIAIGIYIAKSNIESTYSAASVLAVLMIWVYYTSQILFIGASFAYVFGKRKGLEIKPSSEAIRFIQQEVRD